MDKRQIFILAESRNPFELYMLLACILSGVSGLIAPDKSSAAVQEVLPRFMQYIWYTGLVIGGGLALIGFIRNLFIERIGITVLLGITVGYAVILSSKSDRPLSLSFFVVFSFCLACLWRIFQIGKHIRGKQI